MIVPALCAAGVGLGLLTVYRAVNPPSTPARTSRMEHVQRWLRGRGWPSTSLRADIAILRADETGLLTKQVAGALAGLVAVPLGALLLRAVGVGLPSLVPLWLALLGAVVGVMLPQARLRSDAEASRRDFRASVGVYLDLVAMRLASGSGLAEALRDGASIGRGSAFGRIRGALADARTTGLTPAQALDQLGQDLAVADLRDLASALLLVETSGAHAEMTLRAKAASLRERELAATHGLANERTQSMLAAQALLGVAFLLFLGYPAIAVVAGA